ncbi:MAG: YifB family Mg chelatase-like AAA ATPase [Clostridia bacterium]|nr:YifB family Mg chelatase-like AAA ATPase [Clostridia bacterium]
MLSTVYTAALSGIDGFEVAVECDAHYGLGSFDIIGLPDTSVKEAKERVKSAMDNSGFPIGDKSVIINMAPADKKKEGSCFDLAIAASLLANMGKIRGSVDLTKICFIGELSLSGGIRGVRGALPMAIAAAKAGKTVLFLPRENAREASVVAGIRVYGVTNLRELTEVLNRDRHLEPTVFDRSIFENAKQNTLLDFSDVKGQLAAKRAMEIAVAGGHNILMIGPPGTGKSMIAKRIPGIMPPLTFEEAVESTKIHSVAGELKENDTLLCHRPFRSPHHTVSAVALSGGGKNPSPGEISLAHNGVLFLDELPEFSKNASEVLRQPIEDKQITVTRVAGRMTFPASFMLVCAMNPCKCGYLGHPTKPCTCKRGDREKYLSKISGPLLDRIDIHVEVSSLDYDELKDTEKGESSADIRKRVTRARERARERFARDGLKLYCNAQMEAAEIERYCRLDEAGDAILRRAYDAMGLSVRGHGRILKVARTIADLAESEDIQATHIAEAIKLRTLDRDYKNL